MEFIKTSIDGLIEIKPRVFEDSRGYFFESFRKDLFAENGITEDFVQDNQSFSAKGVLRGLHLQLDPFSQGKLVRVTKGKVLDVAVDLRPGSPTFGLHETVVLDTESHNMFYVPAGFAHGFVTLEDAIFTYKCTNNYHKGSEQGIIWNDKELAIDWQVEKPLVSDKDLDLQSFDQFKKGFL